MHEGRNPLHDVVAARLIAAKLLLFAGLAFAVTEVSVVAKADIAVANDVHSATTDWLTRIVIAVSDLASTPALALATVLFCGLLAARRHWHGAAALLLSVIATQAVVSVVKAAVARPRPESGPIGEPSGFSFPSAHSASAVAIYLVLALIATGLTNRRLQAASYLAAGLVVVSVGLSRVYLGAHYPTDVLAGWLTGGIVVLACWQLCSRLPAPARL